MLESRVLLKSLHVVVVYIHVLCYILNVEKKLFRQQCFLYRHTKQTFGLSCVWKCIFPKCLEHEFFQTKYVIVCITCTLQDF